MGKVATYTIKEILLRLISGARLVNRNEVFYLRVYKKGEIRIDGNIAYALLKGGVVTEDRSYPSKKVTHYVCRFEKSISNGIIDKKKEIRVFVMHLWKSKFLDVNFDKANDLFDDYVASLLYQIIQKHFYVWYSEREQYLKQIEDL